MRDDEIRIMILEDNPTDAELVERELRKGGIVFQSKRVETRDDFISQIEEFTPQIILADYKLPAFTGMEAFNIIKEKGLEVPFIIVSGMIGEDLAIEILKAGVTDYILKGNLSWLVPAVNRALAENKMVTERRQAEEALRENEEKYRALIETTNTGYVILDLTGKVLDANDEYARLTGHERRDEILGRSVAEWTAEHDRERNTKSVKKCIRQGFVRNLALNYVGPQQLSIIIEANATLVTGKNGPQILMLCRDITKRKQAEQQMLSLQAQLLQSQKMEAIGRLAGGVAHDFNNLLTVISIQTQLALRGLREGDPLKEKLEDIEQAADRAANLTRQLLAFSRRQILDIKILNLNIIVSDLEKMLHRIIGEDIELASMLADDLGMVKVDPGQMEQVIVNLAVNAKDAMPSGGNLTIETANLELDEGYARSHAGMIPGVYVMLSVSDSGVGMTREVQEQIFDPFFTTKEKGKGTGLGLSTVYGIVKQSGGDIYQNDAEDHGRKPVGESVPAEGW